MSRHIQVIEVKESKEALQKQLRSSSPSLLPRITMLLLILKGIVSNTALAAKTGVNRNRIATYKQLYERGGLLALVEEKRGGNRKGAIPKEIHEKLQERLSDAQGGFTSYKQAMQWIKASFGLAMNYQSGNQYLHYHFHTKLKVGRKSHILG